MDKAKVNSMQKTNKKTTDLKGGDKIVINPPEPKQKGPVDERFLQALSKHALVIEQKLNLVLQAKSAKSAFTEEEIHEVFARGLEEKTPLHLTKEQHAMNKVNSFVSYGSALEEQIDLVEKMGTKGTGGAARPHVKTEKNPYNPDKKTFHVVDAKGNIKMSTTDEFAARNFLASKYQSLMNNFDFTINKADELVEVTTRYDLSDTPMGRTYEVTLVFRGSVIKLNLFFEKMLRPSLEDIQKHISKIYPGSTVKMFKMIPKLGPKNIPVVLAREEKKLNKPFLTPEGPKKRSVYVKGPSGNVVKVNFGDPNMRIKKNDPERRKSFRARHNCETPGPKHKARYWSCKAW